LYPALGYHPNETIVGLIRKYAADHKLPVIVHCSGVAWQKHKQTETHETTDDLAKYTAPSAYLPILQKYPKLRLCLAHFGGNEQWKKYLDDHPIGSTSADPIVKPTDSKYQKLNWVSQIIALMHAFPNVYADTSYTCCNPPYLRKMKELLETDLVVRERVLFGSDYYLTEQEKITDKGYPFDVS